MGYAKGLADQVLDRVVGFDQFLAPIGRGHSVEAQAWVKDIIEMVVLTKNAAMKRAGNKINKLQMASDEAWKGECRYLAANDALTAGIELEENPPADNAVLATLIRKFVTTTDAVLKARQEFNCEQDIKASAESTTKLDKISESLQGHAVAGESHTVSFVFVNICTRRFGQGPR